MNKKWSCFLEDAINANKRIDDFEWSILNGSLGSDQHLTHLKTALDSIKGNRVLIVSVNTDKLENHVFHPYTIRYYNGDFLVCGFSETTNKLEAIPVSSIVNIMPIETIPYKSPTKRQIEDLSNISSTVKKSNSNQLNKSVQGMNQYWEEFNKSGNHKVGNRNQWYNEVRSLRFTDLSTTGIKAYFEICSQFGREQRLIINLILERKDGIDTGLDSFKDSLESSLSEELVAAGFENVLWKKRKGDSRRTVEFVSNELRLVTEDVRDPRTFPVQPTHFKWFNEKLDLLNVIFNDYLEN